MIDTKARADSVLAAVVWISISQVAYSAFVASDVASNAAYANGWQAGDNGGTGFDPWTFAFSGNGSGLFHPPQFIDNGPLAGNSLGAPAFALTTGDRRNQYETSEVRRTFVAPITVGQTFSADVDSSALDPGAPSFTTGNTIDLFGPIGVERFSLITSNGYNANRWTANAGADTGIPAGSSFHIDFTLVSADTYDLVLSPIGGGAPLFVQTGASLAGPSGVGMNRLRITTYGTGSSTNGSKELFFDNLMISAPDVLTGDYNKNGVVDAADYVVWRKTLGQSGSNLPADGNANNEIDAEDFEVWRAQFGEPVPTVGNGAAIISEPGESTMAALFCLLGYILHAWRIAGRTAG